MCKKAGKAGAIEQIAYILPLLERFHDRVTYFQTSAAPTVSPLLYLIGDLLKVADTLADKSDKVQNEIGEAIMSRVLAQIESEFEDDLGNDYLKVQLFDSRVSDRVR